MSRCWSFSFVWMARFAILVAVAGPATSFMSFAEKTCHIKAGMAGKWHLKSSYEDELLPEEGDTIQIDAGVHATANDDDCGFVTATGIAKILPASSKNNPSSLTITINNERTELRCDISGAAKADPGSTLGVIKEGPGLLHLLPPPSSNYGYCMHFTVNNGILQLPTDVNGVIRHYGGITVNSPGILITQTTTTQEGGAGSVYIRRGLKGDGIISNSVPWLQKIRLWDENGIKPVFSGQINGNIQLLTSFGVNTLIGSCDSTNDVQISSSSSLYLASIGGGTEENRRVGSAGSGNILVGDHGTLGYVGAGETTYVQVSGAISGSKSIERDFTLNGGPNGNLNFAGSMDFSKSTNATVALILGGTNASACTLSGKVKGSTLDTRSVRLVKRGSGTWVVNENAESSIKGVVAVEEGVLKFNTIAQAGRNCALGYASLLTEDYGGKYDVSKLVPYAVLLGAPYTCGVLDYTGSEPGRVSTRPIALAGDGVIKSDNASLCWHGVTSVGSGDRNLVLGGAAAGSKVECITNGSGRISLVKEGAGSWTLGGTLDFTGGINVKEGDLFITCETNAFTWLRIFFKENYSGSEDWVDLARLAFFDANGVVQTANLATNAAATADNSLLQPGECAICSLRNDATISLFSNKYYSFNNLFLPEYGSGAIFRFDCPSVPDPNTPTNWPGLILRLPLGANPVTSYDIATRWSQGSGKNIYVPQTWVVEGSTDGYLWEEVSSVVSNRTWGVDAGTWLKSGKKPFYNETTGENDPTLPYLEGWPMRSVSFPESTLDGGIDDLSVAAGASVSSGKTVVTRHITVDCAGMGSASGFALEEGGEIDIVNAPASGPFEVAVDFTGIALPEDYSFTVNGNVVTKMNVSLSPDGRRLIVSSKGFAILVK